MRRSADRTCHVVWLVGPTHLAYASSRGRLRVDGRSSSVLQLATARRLLTGPGHLTPQAARLATVLRLPAAVKLPVALARLQSAPWTARLRDFALDLALGVLPCGKGIKYVDTSLCLFCKRAKDTIQHLAEDCPYLQPLRSWYMQLWAAMAWPMPPPPFHTYLVYGHATRRGDDVASLALHGAILAAAVAARNALITTHLPMRSADIVTAARSRLRDHIAHDHRFAHDGSAARMDARLRPGTLAAFSSRWGTLCQHGDGRLRFVGPLDHPA